MIMLKTLMLTLKIRFIIEKKGDQEEYRLSGDPLVPSDDVLWGRILMARPSSLVWPCLQIRSCLYLKKMYNLSVNLFG